MAKEVYRVAYEEAKLELADILQEFEQLRLRKEQLEKLAELLKPLVEPLVGVEKGDNSKYSKYPWSGR
jgi:hypothetical protein